MRADQLSTLNTYKSEMTALQVRDVRRFLVLTWACGKKPMRNRNSETSYPKLLCTEFGFTNEKPDMLTLQGDASTQTQTTGVDRDAWDLFEMDQYPVVKHVRRLMKNGWTLNRTYGRSPSYISLELHADPSDEDKRHRATVTIHPNPKVVGFTAYVRIRGEQGKPHRDGTLLEALALRKADELDPKTMEDGVVSLDERTDCYDSEIRTVRLVLAGVLYQVLLVNRSVREVLRYQGPGAGWIALKPNSAGYVGPELMVHRMVYQYQQDRHWEAEQARVSDPCEDFNRGTA